MLIRVLDLETTGLTAPDAAPCEIGWQDIVGPDGGDWALDKLGAGEMLCNPSRPIPPEISAIHHIVDEDVEDAVFWPAALAKVACRDSKLFSPTIFAAHNAKMERQWLTDEVTGGKPWICSYKCALRLWPDAPSHSNQALRYWLKPAGLDRARAALSHRAFPDAYVTAFILLEQLKLVSIGQLLEWSSKPALLTKIRFGKHAGKKWSEVPSDYLDWCLRQDMDEDVLFTARHELEQRRVRG
jgi:exodeoxyribonuclease X